MASFRQTGQALLETAMLVPVLILLLVGLFELGRITFTYFTLHKALYAAGRFLGTQPGVNFCDTEDELLTSARNFALSGGTTSESNIANLAPSDIQFRIERYNPDSQQVSECECSLEGCDIASGGRGPDFIVVSIPNGYAVRTAIPFLSSNEILFRPRVRVPVGSN
ncbi:MAG TPA: TadE/TadG family type IV pilus assembly protein [Bryobacteraceae bacterium]|nr:TadE/TadG family type IV pilus assembly protein [Bryobacteraceae bacterium]